jgi:hypothetical protein
MFRTMAILGAAVLMSACASSSGVLPMGPDTYRVSASRHNMAGGEPAAQATALRSAEAHCTRNGRELLVTHTASSFERPLYTFTATFQCLQKGSRPVAERS